MLLATAVVSGCADDLVGLRDRAAVPESYRRKVAVDQSGAKARGAGTVIPARAGGPPRPADVSANLAQVGAVPMTTNIVDGRPKTGDDARVATAPTALTLDAVLNSVERHFPLLLSALQAREIAAGERLTAEGGFDLDWKGAVKAKPQGYYRNNRLDTVLEQPTPLWGTTVFSGYRWGQGDFPTYDEEQTDRGGEFRTGVKVPILQNGLIDERRADLRRAKINQAVAEQTIDQKRIAFIQKSSQAYWKWVAAGHKLDVARALLRIAQERDTGLAALVAKGAIPQMERTDNERLIVQRQAFVTAFQRALEQAAIDLSLYTRDETGNPAIPDPARLPTQFPEPVAPEAEALQSDTDLALSMRPEVWELELQRRRTLVDLQVAENKLLPKTDVTLAGSQDYGQATPKMDKSQFEFEAKVEFELPLQLREARGKVRSTRAKLAKILADLKFARDRVTADVQDAMSALVAAHQRLGQARESLALARKVEELERVNFNAGNSDLLRLNLREQQTADAAATEIDAVAEYYRAMADYRAALGVDAGKQADEVQTARAGG